MLGDDIVGEVDWCDFVRKVVSDLANANYLFSSLTVIKPERISKIATVEQATERPVENALRRLGREFDKTFAYRPLKMLFKQ